MFYLFKYFVYNSYKPAPSPHHTTHHENQEIKSGSLPTSDPQTSLKFVQLSGQCPLQQDGTVQNHTLHLVSRSLVRKKVWERGRMYKKEVFLFFFKISQTITLTGSSNRWCLKLYFPFTIQSTFNYLPRRVVTWTHLEYFWIF